MPALQPRPGHFGLILPLCTSSATLGLALLQYPMFNSFLTSREPSIAGRPLSAYWAATVQQTVPIVASAPLVSALAGLLAARWLRGHATLETGEVGRWYNFGAALAAGHFAFVPVVAPLIQRMVGRGRQEAGSVSEAEVEKGNREDMGTWFVWHTVRLLTVDVPALWCFAEGAALSFWVI